MTMNALVVMQWVDALDQLDVTEKGRVKEAEVQDVTVWDLVKYSYIRGKSLLQEHFPTPPSLHV